MIVLPLPTAESGPAKAVRRSWMSLPDLPGRRWSIPILCLYWIVTVSRSVIPSAHEHSSRVSGYWNVAGCGEMPQTPCGPGGNQLSRNERARAAAGRMKAWMKKVKSARVTWLSLQMGTTYLSRFPTDSCVSGGVNM